MAISSAIGAAVVAGGATAYAAHESRVASAEATRSGERIAAANRRAVDTVDLPNTTATAANVQAAQQQAASAGGTIKSTPGQLGDNANAPRKTLLGL